MYCMKCGKALDTGMQCPDFNCRNAVSVCSNELLGCPFCGGRASVIKLTPNNSDNAAFVDWSVECDECDASIDWFLSEDEAKKAWNTRAT